RLGRFDLPEQHRYDQPTQLGEALLSYLRQHKFNCTHAIVGVPARWLIAHARELPPVGREQAALMLRLQAERLSADGGELVFDFAGALGSPQAASGLLVGILKDRLLKLQEMCASAGLKLHAITSTALAISQLNGGDASVLLLADGGAEMVLRRDGAPTALRSLAAARSEEGLLVGSLAGEVKRSVALGGAGGGGLLLCNGLGISRAQAEELGSRSGLTLAAEVDLPAMGATAKPDALNGDTHRLAADRFAPAVSLAIAGADPASLPINFVDSRLAAIEPPRFGRRTIIAALLGVALIGSIVALMMLASSRESELAIINRQLAEMDSTVKTAAAEIDRFSYGMGYFDRRPPVLDCLKEISLAYGYDPIWTINFTLRDNLRGQIQGKAADISVVLAVADRLRANPNFRNVQSQDTRDTAGRTREVSFTISFVYEPKAGAK
ncbi:MAG TPA: hypothetical protein PKB10_02135, partial [Tepidisphaeraceae bacterium]|nr:hypothetical protein [Tepidisphaeraceae bacterium]